MTCQPPNASTRNIFQSRRRRVLGVTGDRLLSLFFGSNAVISVVVLGLITLFLFREGAGFFPKNLESLRTYRQTGLECIEHMQATKQDFQALVRYLSDVRLRMFEHYSAQGLDFDQINDEVLPLDDFIYAFEENIFALDDLVGELTATATRVRERHEVAANNRELRENLLAQGRDEEAAAVKVEDVSLSEAADAVAAGRPQFYTLLDEMAVAIPRSLEELPELPVPALQERLVRFRELANTYITTFEERRAGAASWDPQQPIPAYHAVTSFLLGKRWVTNSFFQDWYGMLPLLTGSLLVSCIALFFAVPFSIAAAIYVNQIAGKREQAIIKPVIEFIAAIPSVVIGFFGVVVLGELLRQLSGWEFLSWVPGFPMAERLNAFTAGCLLALMATPTIFTLSEDALNNVPRAFREASLAVGATRLQTIVKIILPTALSGIISAVLLGFGRVIGETMVVLLCAGNRIAIPDFTQGIGVFFQPVHTMTGIVAQEMGEVVRGSLHYRSLFLVGMVLFMLSLLINFFAQKIVHRYRLPQG